MLFTLNVIFDALGAITAIFFLFFLFLIFIFHFLLFCWLNTFQNSLDIFIVFLTLCIALSVVALDIAFYTNYFFCNHHILFRKLQTRKKVYWANPNGSAPFSRGSLRLLVLPPPFCLENSGWSFF